MQWLKPFGDYITQFQTAELSSYPYEIHLLFRLLLAMLSWDTNGNATAEAPVCEPTCLSA
jgi:hypothetical protein